MIRSLITLAFVVFLIVLATTVPLGQRTLFGHLVRIWRADETQSLVEGVVEKSGPVFERVKRGVKAGVEEAAEDPKPEAKP